jgi:hypothetical protein
VSVCPVERWFFGSQISPDWDFLFIFIFIVISQGGNSIEGETVTWDEERRSSDGGSGRRALFCLLMSLKRMLRLVYKHAARPKPTGDRIWRSSEVRSMLVKKRVPKRMQPPPYMEVETKTKANRLSKSSKSSILWLVSVSADEIWVGLFDGSVLWNT